MLDIKVIRQDPHAVATALTKRGFTFDVAEFEALDARRKQADITAQNLQSRTRTTEWAAHDGGWRRSGGCNSAGRTTHHAGRLVQSE